MSDIFEEVEEEVRKDKLSEVWRRYGFLVWLAALGIVGYVAYSEWSTYRAAQTQEERIVMLESALTALETGETELALSQLTELVEADTALSPLAAHYLARARVEGGGDVDGAVAALNAAADADGRAFEQLALLKSVYLRGETMTLEEMERELAPLTALETPLGALAQEAIAGKAYATGDYARARTMLNRLRLSAYAPSGLVRRATIALEAIPRATTETDGTDDETEPMPDEAAPASDETPIEETE